jgi:5-methyltetrahydropteroyltriglutamate--homocysteine methyltransferase
VQTRHDAVRVIGKLDFPADHPMLDHFRFLKQQCDVAHVTPKMTIPSPAVLHFRGGRKSISKEVYPDLEPFFEDLGKTYRKAVKAFYDAGCRYLQFDDTVWAYLCSQEELQKARERGDNPDGLQEIYARIINYAIADRPSDMVITTHVCRGNFRSTWISSGGYEPVAETLLAGTNYDGYFGKTAARGRSRERSVGEVTPARSRRRCGAPRAHGFRIAHCLSGTTGRGCYPRLSSASSRRMPGSITTGLNC